MTLAEQRAKEWWCNRDDKSIETTYVVLAEYGKVATISALEEAARRTCVGCKENVPILNDGLHREKIAVYSCYAEAIHGLIAELREEK